MKKLITVMCALCTMLFTGCLTTPTVDSVETISYTIGLSAGMVANQTKIDDTTRNKIIDIINEVRNYTPNKGESLPDTWTQIAENHVNNEIENGKITEEQGKVILTVFKTVINAGHYIVTKKWPELPEYVDLMIAAQRGMCDGFLNKFVPSTMLQASDEMYDVDAYEYLNSIK